MFTESDQLSVWPWLHRFCSHSDTCAHAHTRNACAHMHPPHRSPRSSELLRPEGGMAAARSFLISLPGLLLILNFTCGSTTSGNRRANQERCGFKVKQQQPQLSCVDASLQQSSSFGNDLSVTSPVDVFDVCPWDKVCVAKTNRENAAEVQ